MRGRAAALRRVAIAVWLFLVLSVAAWPLGAGIGRLAWTLALAPLLLPLPWILGDSVRALRAASLALAPLLAVAVTEYLVNAPARPWAGMSLALAFAAFAAIVAAIRASPRP